MSDGQFTKLFKYIEKRFDGVDKHFEQVHDEVADLKGAVGELAGQIRDYHQEMIMLTHKVDRLERWIHEIAKKTGVKLSEA